MERGEAKTFLQCATSLENTFMIGQCWEKCFGIIEIMGTGVRFSGLHIDDWFSAGRNVSGNR